MPDIVALPLDFADRLSELKTHIHSAQLMYVRALANAWSGAAIVQQTVGQLPWHYHSTHHFSAESEPA